MDKQRFLDKSFLLTLTTKFVALLNCTPIKLNQSQTNSHLQNVTFVAKTGSQLKRLKLGSFLLSLAACIEIFQVTMHFKMSTNYQPSTTDSILLCWVTCITLVGPAMYVHISQKNGKTLQMYFNSLLTFKKTLANDTRNNCINQNKSVTEVLTLLLVPVILFSMIGFAPLFVLGFHWYDPCKPSLLGYFILPECHDIVSISFQGKLLIVGWIFKGIILFGNVWLFYFACYGACYILISVHILSTMLIQENVQLFWKQLKASHNKYNDAMLYRQLQIFNTLCNSVQQSCLCVFIAGQTVLVSVMLCLLVGHVNEKYEETNKVMIATFTIMTVDGTLTILLTLGGMASVFKDSKSTLSATKRLESTLMVKRERLWLQKYLRSCSEIKVKFGDNNFIEELTPLRCVHFAIDLTAQFLLLSGMN